MNTQSGSPLPPLSSLKLGNLMSTELYIESVGSIPAPEIFVRSIEKLQKSLQDFSSKVVAAE